MNYVHHSRLFLLIREHRYLLGSLYAVFYLSWFRLLERTVTPESRICIMHCGADDIIPVLPVFIIPYLFWFVYVLGSIFWFGMHDPDEMTRLGISLAGGMTICLLICTLFPNGTDLRIPADPYSGLFSKLLWIIQRADTTTNVFPSIHVYNSLAVNSAVHRSMDLRHRPLVLAASSLAAILICFSTVFLKQHSLIDLAGACILAYFMERSVYSGVPVPVPAGAGQKKKAMA